MKILGGLREKFCGREVPDFGEVSGEVGEVAGEIDVLRGVAREKFTGWEHVWGVGFEKNLLDWYGGEGCAPGGFFGVKDVA